MNPPHLQSLGRAGQYFLLEELRARPDGSRLYTGSDGAGRHAVVMLPPSKLSEDEGYRLRFWAEAANSGRMNHRCIANVAGASHSTEAQPWIAYDVFPALPLAAAVPADDGKLLSAEAACSLALVLADALHHVHAQGLVFAGISPESLLLTPTGPRLTGFGLVRAASPEGTPRTVVPGVPAGSLPPEQQTGSRPEPAGDIYALGTVLVYALTGRYPDPDASLVAGLAEPLRQLVGECLSVDPSQRPRADLIVHRLHQAGVQTYVQFPEAVQDSLSNQLTRLPPSLPGHLLATSPASGGQEETVASSVALPSRRSPSRRSLFLGAAGAVGLALGVGGVAGWRALGDDERKAPRKLSIEGTGPAPLWRYTPGGGELGKHAITGTDVLINARPTESSAIDLRTGKELWSREDLLSNAVPLNAGRAQALISGVNEFHLVSVRSGQIKWTEKKYATQGQLTFLRMLGGVTDGIVHFLGESVDEQNQEERYRVVAYRLSDRKEVWRRKVPPGYPDSFASEEGTPGPVVRDGVLLIPNTGSGANEEWFTYLALDTKTGKRLWKRSYAGARRDSLTLRLPAPGKQFIAVDDVENKVRAYDLKSGKVRWGLNTRSALAPEPVFRGNIMYAADSKLDVHAVDVRSGRRLWSRNGGAVPYAGGGATGTMAISASHRTLFRSADLEIGALRARDGAPLWRMAMVDGNAVTGGSGKVVHSAPGMVLVATRSTLYALPVD